MPIDYNQYEGRKGQKKLKAIEKQVERLEEDFDSPYVSGSEMVFLNEEITWDVGARIMFLIAMRYINHIWEGSRDYGFIRLCVQWIDSRGIRELSSDDAIDMLSAILPEDVCDAVRNEITDADIEIS